MHHREKSSKSIFASYEAFRRPGIEAACEQAAQRWETVKDGGWLMHNFMMFITSWFLWWTAKAREQEFAEDHTGLELDIPD